MGQVIITQLAEQFPDFTEPESLLPCSKKAAILYRILSQMNSVHTPTPPLSEIYFNTRFCSHWNLAWFFSYITFEHLRSNQLGAAFFRTQENQVSSWLL